MWVKMKCYKGLTLESVAKMHKIKKPADIWTYPNNKKLKKAYDKAKGFAEGDMLTIPDPKKKVYVVEYKGKTYMLDTAEKKKFEKMLGARMDEIHKVMIQAFNKTKSRHDAQKKVNSNNEIAYAFSRSWLGSKEPGIQLAMAKGALAALGTCVATRDYKTFESKVKVCEKMINTYRDALHKWIDGLVDSAENIAVGLTITKEASFVVFGTAAMVLAAPVSIPAAMGVGAVAGGSTAFMSSAGNELGKSIANDSFNPEKSGAKILKDTAIGVGLGAAGGAFSKFVSGKLITDLGARVLTTASLKKVAKRVIDGKDGHYISKFYDGAVQRRTEDLEGKAGQFIRKKIQGSKSLIIQAAIVKVLAKNGKGDVEKILEKVTSKSTDAALTKLNASGKLDADKIAAKLATDFEKTPMMDLAYKQLLDKNKSKIEAEVDAQVKAIMDKLSKVAAMI